MQKMLDRQFGSRVSLLASGKIMMPFLSALLLLALCDQSTATTPDTPYAVENLMLTIDTTTNMLSIQWTDTQEDLDYQISYNVSARTILLFSSDDIFVTNAMVVVSSTTDSFMYDITNATYFVEGVTVNVTVEAVNDTEVGQAEMSAMMAPGTFAPPVNSLMATSDTTIPVVNLTWTIPYPDIPPDSYMLTYTATKLSGVALAQGTETTMVDFSDTQTTSVTTDVRLYTVTDLLFYSHYQFELTAVYGGDSSTATSVNVTMTAEGIPGPVRNLTVGFSEPTVAMFNATAGTYDITADLSWVEPEEPDGVILEYVYSVALETDPSDIVASGTTMMTTREPSVTVLAYMRYNFTVTARTGGGLGTPVSKVEFSPEAAPSAAQNLIASSNGTHILISWSAPANPNGIVTYDVVVTETDLLTTSTSTIVSETMVTELELAVSYVVESYSKYTVNVTSQTGVGMGEPEMFSFQTPEEAPSAPRNVILRESTSTSAVIQWTEPEFPNGIIRNYTLSLTNANDGTEVNITTDQDQLSLNITGLDPFTQYWIVVYAETIAVGEGSSNFSIRTLQDIPSPVQNLAVNSNSSHILIMWGAPANPNGLVNYTVVVQEIDLLTREITLIENLTVTEEDLVVEYQVRPYSMYNVSVTSLTIVGEGEVVRTSFMTEEEAPSPARNLTLDYNDTHIFITWAAPAYPNGVVTYTVEVQERSLLEDTSVPATAIESVVTAELALIVDYMVEPYSEYTVSVTSQTSAGMGVAVNDSFQTPEGVPSPVRNLMRSFNDTHITIIWEAPEFPDGLVNYTVVIQERDLLTDNADIILMDVVVDLMLIFNYSVEVYSEYTINVTSQTGAGEGETETTMFQTPEEVPSPARNVNVSFNDTNIIITWEPPSEPNGIVNYTVVLQETDLLLNTSVDIASEEVTELTLFVPYVTKPYREYVASVTAQTSAGMGESAEGTLMTPEGVPSELQNLTITQQNNETLLIRWVDSAMPNGILTYTIYVTCFDLATNNFTFAEVYTASFGGDLSISVHFPGGLEPYAEYTARALASTSAGNSSEMSNNLTTPQGESEPPLNLMTTPTNISVTVEWDAPVDANGIISSYQVDLFNSSDDEIDSVLVGNLMALEHIFEGLLPYTDYSVEVRAVTGDMGDILGQWAEDSFMTDVGIPTVPINVMIVSGVGSLTVSWMPPDLLNAPAVSYTLQYSMTGSSTEPSTIVADDTMVVIGGLAAFTEYSVVVQACSSAGCGPFTTPETERTQEEAPSEPLNVTAMSINSTSILIMWEQPESPNGILRFYRVTYSSGQPGTVPITANTTDNATSVIINNLDPFTSYNVSVAGVTVDEGPCSDVVTIMTNESAPTATPQLLAEMVVTDTTTITIVWVPPPMGKRNGIIRSYTVTYSPTNNTSALPIEESVLGNETSFTASDLEPFTNYTFKVAAVTISPGPLDTIVVQTNESAPSAPVIMEAFNTSSTSIRIIWIPPRFPNGIIRTYIITYYYITIEGLNVSVSMTVMGDATMVELTGLMIFTNYSISVQAMTVVPGDPSETVNVTTNEDLPSAPQILEAIEIDSTTVTIQVTFVPPASPNGIITHYLVNYSISDSLTNLDEVSMRINAVGGQMSYTVELTNLTEFTNYTIEVSAFTRIGEGNVSTKVVMTNPDVASPPTDLVATPISSTAVELMWGYPLFPRGLISGYVIYIDQFEPPETNLTLEVVDDRSNQSLIVDMLMPYTEYTFGVAAYAFHRGEVIVGVRSEMTVRTLEAAPSAPLSFTLSPENQTSDQLLATWETPNPTNGDIISYTVFCRENSTMSNFVISHVVQGIETMAQLPGLSPFTAYECFVTASTSVGAGNASNVDVERTNEAAPSEPPQNINGTFIDSTSIRVSWTLPPISSRNGIIRHYIIKYSQVDDSNVQTVNTSGLLVVIADLEKYTEYEVNVSAVTIEEGPFDSTVVRTDSDVPSEPLNLISMNITARSFVVTWSPPSDLNSPGVNYTLQLIGPSSNVRNFTGIEPKMFPLVELLPFTNYTVVVFAVSEKGPGPGSEMVTVMTLEDRPAAPQNFMLEVISSRELQASWDIPDPTNGLITNYTIRCSSSGAQPPLTTVMGNVTSFVLSGLSPFTSYSCNVSATTGAGEGPNSENMTALTDEDVPSAPVNFMVVDTQAQQVNFSWLPPLTPNGDVSGYMLNYSNSTHNLNLSTITADQRMVTVENLNEFTEYRFELRAMTGAGLGEPAIENQRTAEAAPSTAPLNVTGEFNDSTSLNITWSPPPFPDQNGNIVAYNVTYQRTDDIDSWMAMTSTSDRSIISGLRPFTNYSVKVAAFTVDIGPFSEPIIVTTDSDTPSAPRNVTATNVTRGSITITWLPPDPTNGIIESYSIEVTPVDMSYVIQPIDELPADVFEYNITDLMDYVNYSIVVFAFTDKGMGMGSEAIVVQTLEHHPDEPTRFNVVVLNSTSMNVTWGPPADPNGIILSYHLFVELDPNDAAYLPGNPTMNITIEDPDARSYVLTDLHEFATYYLSLTAATAQGIGNSTDRVTMTTDMAAPSSSVENINTIAVQPTSVTLTWNPPPIRDWNGMLVNYTISYKPVMSCNQTDEMFQDFDVSSNSLLTPPTSPRYPRTAYNLSQSQMAPLVENFMVDDLEEFVSYVFTVTVETSKGSSPPVSSCFKTEPNVPGVPILQSFTTLSNTTASVSWVLPPMDHNGILDEYIVQLTNMNASMFTNFTVPANESTLTLSELVPFTDYNVSVAASNQERGAGEFSLELENRTSEGVPSAPLGLTVEAINTTYIQLSWEPPAMLYASQLGPYFITYYRIDQTTEVENDTTNDTSITLTGLIGDSTYIIEVRASTVAGQGNSSSTTNSTLKGATPALNYSENPEIMPVKQVDENGEPVNVTSTSFVVQFELLPEQELNGQVDKYWIYVWRQPSTNDSIANYYESSRMTSNFSQYASVEQTPQRSRKRATGGMMQTVVVGGNEECRPMDNPCNGPLAPESDYFVRYTLFSGDQRTEYNFTDQSFSTNAAPTTAPITTPTTAPTMAPNGSSMTAVIAAVVVVVLVAVIVLVVVVIVIVLYMKKRRRGDFDLKMSKYKNGHNGDQKLLPRNESGSSVPFLGRSDPGIVPIHEMKEGGTPLKASQARFPRHIQNTKVYLKDFSEHLKSMLDDSNYKFSEEYERVTEIGLEHAKEASLMAENRAKNRYTNILAYDHSRVKLSFVDDEPGSDYINASYIPGHRMRRAYVATQGPLPATFDDFWRMVWEQNTHVIVMLTQLVERGRTKCHRYWPGTEPSVYGDIAVEMMSEKEKEDWTIREFKLSVPDRRTRLVRHYQFTSWPDHGVPDSPMAAIDFVKTVRSQAELHHGPMVVHCSAGVGRTGCFIALDTLQQHVRDHDWVDIYGLACEMRQHRNHMIQTEAQYVFIHKSMQEIIDSIARYGPGIGMGTGTIGSSGIHMRPGYSSVFANPFAEEASTTQMSDYYGDYLSEETHM